MTPSIFGRYPKNIDLHARKYKAEYWANFLHHYSLPLFKDNINNVTFMMWKEFALGRTTLRLRLPHQIVMTLRQHLPHSNCYYQVYRRKRDRLTAWTCTVHALC